MSISSDPEIAAAEVADGLVVYPPQSAETNKPVITISAKQWYGTLGTLPNRGHITLNSLVAEGYSNEEANAVLEELQERGFVSITADEDTPDSEATRYPVGREGEKKDEDRRLLGSVALAKIFGLKHPEPTADEKMQENVKKGHRELAAATFRDRRSTFLNIDVGPLPHIDERVNHILARQRMFEAMYGAKRQRENRSDGPEETIPGFDYLDVNELKDIPPAYRSRFTNENLEKVAREIGLTISQRFKDGEDFEQAKQETVEAMLQRELGPDAPAELRDKFLRAELVAGKLIEKRPKQDRTRTSGGRSSGRR